MIAVRMGDKYRIHRGGPKGCEDRLEMGGVVRAGVDNCDWSRADQIGVCPPIGHRSRIWREQAPHARLNHLRHTGHWLFRFPSHCAEIKLLTMKVHWLRRYMPRSLYGRAAVALLLPVIALQFMFSLGFIQRHFEDVTRQMTRNILLEINALVAEVEAAPDAFLAADAARVYGQAIEIETELPAASPFEDSRTFADLSGRAVISTLRAGLDGLAAVDLTGDPDRVALLIETANGPLGLGFDRRRVSAENPTQLLVLMIVASIIMATLAYIFMSNQLRPIRVMSEAAEAFGRGQLLPFKPDGATELRQAGTAFLEMRNRVERHIEQRTLMLSGVSHDIRTPLTRMRLELSMLPDSAEKDALERDVADMEEMLDAFLSFARGESEAPPEPVRPEELLSLAVDRARKAGADVVLGEMPADPIGLARLRPLAIERALDNLISNGARHGDRVMVSLAATQRVLRFTVEDNGPGIAVDARDEALRPFTRLDAARNQDHGTGVGLGLAIAADVARQHGGTLRLSDSTRLGGLAVDLVIAR